MIKIYFYLYKLSNLNISKAFNLIMFYTSISYAITNFNSEFLMHVNSTILLENEIKYLLLRVYNSYEPYIDFFKRDYLPIFTEQLTNVNNDSFRYINIKY